MTQFIQALSIDWTKISPDSYLRSIPAIASLDYLPLRSNVVFFVGENATGKSTLLEGLATAYGFNPEGGTLNYRFTTWYEETDLGDAMRLSKHFHRPRQGYFFRAESFFNVATVTNLEYNDGSMPDYHAQSHGESFLAFLQNECREGV